MLKKHGQVIWWEDFEQEIRKWKTRLTLTIVISILIVAFLGNVIRDDNQRFVQFMEVEKQVSRSELRWKILSSLKGNTYSLSQGMEVADMIISQADDKNIPVEKIMGLAKAESDFNPKAVSHKKALGLFQIHPVTWNEYTEKLGMKVSMAAAFDPVTNAFVAVHILKDLYENYKLKTGRDNDETWKLTFAAYRDGKTGLQKTGLNKTHTPYLDKINGYGDKFKK